MSDTAPSLQGTITPIANSGGWSGGATFQSSSSSIPYIYEQYWQGSYQANRGFKYLHPERIWVDNGSEFPVTFEGGSVVAGVSQTAQNPQIVKGYDSNGTTSYYSFNNPYYDANWTPGPTVTQTRTTHTGIIPNANDFTIRNPSPGSLYRKTGHGAFAIKFLDQNEPASYGADITYTTAVGTWTASFGIGAGSGDIELNIVGTTVATTPVNGPITFQIDQRIINNGTIFIANSVIKTFTYYETGPYAASFSPDFGLPGQTVGFSVTDTNPYPEEITTYQVEQTPGGSLISGTLTSANNYSISINVLFTSQHGTYKIYDSDNNVIATANYDTNYVAPTTSSNEGGKRRRYPIISTNLFDRQRSIYSIGMTHKDDTLF